MKLIKQCQEPWGGMKLGASNETCCKSGCVVTSLCSLSEWYGNYISPDKAIPKLKFTNEGLLYWESMNKVFPFSFVYRYNQRDDNKIKEILNSKDNACLLKVWGGTHWVALVGYSRVNGYKVFDPLEGNICWLSQRYGSGIYGFTEITRNNECKHCPIHCPK